ncbi:AbrB family transcriptional regulator [Rhodoplanes sp. TEM]|uniref:AbrB family transcriptional regulator n=1 Tax=Rhodoplanes tepidamans TaxID=200616 RepID=A0ABT5JAA2_RHOTP|nr:MULTISPECIES: AbrB family transcriptional regulator [Rhodoplanes]MDC7786378.1 AbrB family transcriptional regulator [Rhodoplanes tepidamans]MDC7985450.1 AbrB family transcriptional regulator [Rhodoplanes sp. TEM]
MQTRSNDSVRPDPGSKRPLPSPRHLFETLVIATVGAVLFDLAKIPAAWLAGAMVTTAVAALAGRPVGVPRAVARGFFVIVGLSLGGVVSPASLHGIAAWPISIAAVVVAMGCVTVATTFYLRKVHGWDAMTALFAGVPGALSQVLAHAVEEKCDVRGIAIVQTMRVVILTVGVPVVLAAFGQGGPTGLAAPPSGLLAAPAELAVLVVLAIAVGLLLMRIGFPGGLMIGPMTVSAVLHGTGLVTVTLPAWVTIAGMIGLGAVSGSRFAGTSVTLVLSYLAAALGSFTVAVGVSAVFVLALTLLLGLRVGDLTVAFSPGAIDAMMVLSLALHIDPVFVGAHHIARVFAVSFSLPVVIRYVARLRRRKGDDTVVK